MKKFAQQLLPQISLLYVPQISGRIHDNIIEIIILTLSDFFISTTVVCCFLVNDQRGNRIVIYKSHTVLFCFTYLVNSQIKTFLAREKKS